MTNYSIKRIIIFGTILLLTGFAAYAFAHGGGYHMGGDYGYGMMAGYHRGGYGMMDGYHMGGHMWNDLSRGRPAENAGSDECLFFFHPGIKRGSITRNVSN